MGKPSNGRRAPMPDNRAAAPEKTDPSAVPPGEALLLGALAQAYQEKRQKSAGRDAVPQVSMAELQEALSRNGRPGGSGLESQVRELLQKYKWLGLEWIASSRSVGPVRGIHWFADSKMFGRLVSSDHETLARMFADIWSHHLDMNAVVSFRLLADAGSTTFRCLSHPDCQLDGAKEIYTNNLFVAQMHTSTEKVRLIEGSWDRDTGATVNVQRAARHLGGTRQPDVAIMSWHYVKARAGDVIFGTNDEKEQDMKEAAVEKTSRLVFMVVDRGKFRDLPHGAREYSLKEDLLALQREDGVRREVFLITDFDTLTPEFSSVLEVFRDKKVTGLRVWLVSGCPGGSTWSKA